MTIPFSTAQLKYLIFKKNISSLIRFQNKKLATSLDIQLSKVKKRNLVALGTKT